jgi:hypothetical protein
MNKNNIKTPSFQTTDYSMAYNYIPLLCGILSTAQRA